MRAKLLYGGRRERVPACFRQTADGRGGVTQRFGGLIPAARVCLGSGCKDAFDRLLFPRVPLRYALADSANEYQRQRKEEQRVSYLHPEV